MTWRRRLNLVLASMALAMTVSVAGGGADKKAIEIPQDRIWALRDLAAAMTDQGSERHISPPYEQRLLFVSAGAYTAGEIDLAIAQALALEWRDVGPVRLLVDPEASSPAATARTTLAVATAELRDRLPVASTPFSWLDHVRDQAPRPFAGLSEDQRLWVAGHARTTQSAGILGGRPLTLDELRHCTVQPSFGFLLVVGRMCRLGEVGGRGLWAVRSRAHLSIPVRLVSPEARGEGLIPSNQMTCASGERRAVIRDGGHCDSMLCTAAGVSGILRHLSGPVESA